MTTETQGAGFRISTYTDGNQRDPSVTGLADGGFVVTWDSWYQDGDGWGVYGQRYDAEGNTQGAEFRINTRTASAQQDPSVTGLAGGGFVVTWESYYDQDGDGSGVYGRRYDAQGNAQGTEFLINTETQNWQADPSVTALSNGGFVVTWDSWGQDGSRDLGQDGSRDGVYGQRYDANGNPQGTEFQVNQYTADWQRDSSVTGLAGGGFVVAWSSWQQDGSDYGVYARHYDAEGNPQGAEFQANTETENRQYDSSVTGLADGGFVVTWESYGQDGGGWDVYGQRYDATGDAQGTEFLINTETEDFQTDPSVTALSSGGFVVTWVSWGQDGEFIYGRRYDAQGTAQGGEFRVSTETGMRSWQYIPSMTGLADGGFVVTWQSGDGNGTGVYGQRFLPPGIDNPDGPTDGDDVLTGTENPDAIDALAGNDAVTGLGGNDTLYGNAGNDDIFAGNGNDYAEGGGGNDELYGGNGNDTIWGGAGDDVVGGGQGADEIGGGEGNDRLWGGAGNDTIYAGNGDDQIGGGGGDDELWGVNGNDTIWGGAGDDDVGGGQGADEIGGGDGDDRLWGGDGDDELWGGDGDDELWGGAGADTLEGGAGADVLDGGAGRDTLDGGAGADVLDGGAGDDRASYWGSDAAVNVNLGAGTALGGFAEGDVLTGIEHLSGSGYNDTLTGDDGRNWLDGGAGADVLDGGAGRWDRAIYAGSGAGVNVNLGAGTATGGHAEGDTLTGIEILIGSDFADTLTGDDGDDGDNVFEGGAGADVLDGGAGRRDWAAYWNSDAGVNVNLATGTGRGGDAEGDTLTGIEDLEGSDFADTLTGDDGDNWLWGDAGADVLDGGAGDDWASYWDSDAAVNVNLATGTGRGGHAEGDVLTGIERLEGSDFADTLTGDDGDNWLWGDAGADVLDGGAGNDGLRGDAGDDVLNGGAGDDWLDGDEGADVLIGGAGDDRADYRRSDAGVNVNLGAGTAQGGHAEGDSLTGFERLYGSEHNDTLTGDDGDNLLEGDLGDDALNGGAGDDGLDGGEGDDALEGGAGDDTLEGGAGADVLTGGAGADVFVFRATDGVVDDTIADFEDGTDSVQIQGSVFGDLTIADSGDDVSVTWGTGNTLTFTGLDRTLLTADDFVFV